MITKHNVFMAILATWIMILFIMLCTNIVGWGIVICNILRG